MVLLANCPPVASLTCLCLALFGSPLNAILLNISLCNCHLTITGRHYLDMCCWHCPALLSFAVSFLQVGQASQPLAGLALIAHACCFQPMPGSLNLAGSVRAKKLNPTGPVLSGTRSQVSVCQHTSGLRMALPHGVRHVFAWGFHMLRGQLGSNTCCAFSPTAFRSCHCFDHTCSRGQTARFHCVSAFWFRLVCDCHGSFDRD